MARGRESFAYLLDMGLGKTSVVLAEAVVQIGRIAGLIVVCPNSLKYNWINEAQKFKTNIAAAAWPDEADTDAGLWMQVINYEAIITPRGYAHISKLLTFPTMLVLDESIHIKNPQAKRTKALIALSKEAKYRRILSGAPVVQGPHDLWAQLRFLGALSGVNFYVFRNTYCVMGGWKGKQVVGSRNEEGLTAMINSIGFRAKKSDWLDLPDKIYTTRSVELTDAQKKHYIEMANDFMTTVVKSECSAQMVLTQMQKLQQIGSNFLIDDTGEAHTLEGTNPKLELLLEILEEITGKVIIFTYYRYSTQLLHRMVKNSLVIIGGLDREETERAIVAFNKDSTIRVLIAQIQTGKYGHNLLGGEGDDACATTIFYENSFSLDARMQAEDRNHRIGQKRAVVYIDLLATPIDQMAIDALQRKQNVAQRIVDGIRSGEASGDRGTNRNFRWNSKITPRQGVNATSDKKRGKTSPA